MAPEPPDGEKPLVGLRDSLAAFRDELGSLLQAQKKHNATRQQMQDLYVRLLWNSQHRDSEQSDPPTGSAARAVGIAGVGKLSDDSPSSKGARAKKHAVSLQALGGEDAMRDMVLHFLSADGLIPDLTRESIQDLWADELSGTTARVSALLTRRRDGSGLDCRQFALVKDGPRWRITQQKDMSMVEEAKALAASDLARRKEDTLKAIELNPTLGEAYADLAPCLGAQEKVCLHGEEYGEKDLYIKALKTDPSLTQAYEKLGSLLKDGEQVRIRGKVFTKQSLSEVAASIDKDAPSGRDLWDKVASDIAQGSLVEEFVSAAAAADEDHLPLPGIKGQAAVRPLAKLPEARASRDLWSPVAAEIESGHLPTEFDLARARAAQTPVSGAQEPPALAGAIETPGSTPLSASHVSELDAMDRSTPSGDRLGLQTVLVSPSGAVSLGKSALTAWGEGGDAPTETKAEPVTKSRPKPAKQLSGLSPLHRPKDMAKLFEEIDSDGDGVLGKEDLQSYLQDYLGYGEAEVLSFLSAHQPEGAKGVDLPAFKKGMKELKPYLIHDRFNKMIVRKPGAFGGMDCIDFHVEDCSGCTCLICEKSAEFHADGLVNCRVLIGPCENSIFVRNCENCTFWAATKQFRVRECSNCTFYLHCHTEPIIESSKDLRIGPLCATYPGLSKQFAEAKFDASRNFWNAIYDFTGKAGGANWQIQPLDECEQLVVSFEGCSEKPDGPSPEITQALLCAEPMTSGESQGQSMANIPQTRPARPAEPVHGTRLRRLVSDAAGQDIGGKLEKDVVADDPLFTSVAGKPSQDPPEDAESSSDEVEILDMEDDDPEPQRERSHLGEASSWRPGTASSAVASRSNSQQKARAATAAAAEASLAPLQRGGGQGNIAAKRPLGGLRLSMASGSRTSPPEDVEADTRCKKLVDSSDEDDDILLRKSKPQPKAAGRQNAGAGGRGGLDSDDDHPAEGSSALTSRQRSLLAGLAPKLQPGLLTGSGSSDEETLLSQAKARRDPKASTSSYQQAKRLADRSQTGKERKDESESTSDDD